MLGMIKRVGITILAIVVLVVIFLKIPALINKDNADERMQVVVEDGIEKLPVLKGNFDTNKLVDYQTDMIREMALTTEQGIERVLNENSKNIDELFPIEVKDKLFLKETVSGDTNYDINAVVVSEGIKVIHDVKYKVHRGTTDRGYTRIIEGEVTGFNREKFTREEEIEQGDIEAGEERIKKKAKVYIVLSFDSEGTLVTYDQRKGEVVEL